MKGLERSDPHLSDKEVFVIVMRLIVPVPRILLEPYNSDSVLVAKVCRLSSMPDSTGAQHVGHNTLTR